ncbi:DUF4097 domain-containing protein [Falsibacillus pallidus]|uniref:DUF4097 domain-containing protein n=1 Tax=Falsibacillus pallidus TaxID=493781 RepID=UPI003D96054A
MKKWVAVLLILFFIGVGGSVMTIYASGGLNFNTVDILQSKTVDGDSVQSIAVDCSSTDVSIREAQDQNDIKVKMTGNVSKKLKDDYKLNVSSDKGTLIVGLDVRNMFHVGFNVRNVKIEITVPEKIYDRLAVQVKSGDIDVDGLKSKEANLETASGDLILKNLENASQLDIQASSGDVEIKDSHVENLKFKANSGDLVIDGVSAKTSDLSTSSGDMDISNLSGNILANLASGDLTIRNAKDTGDITADMASGDVTITFKEKPTDLAVDFKANSGDGKVQLDGFLFEEKEEDRILGKIGSGKHLVKVHAASGDFVLK